MSANHADILTRLRADVAAASDTRTCDDRGSAFRQGCSDCEQNFPDPKARARIAELDGPALLERLVAVVMREDCDVPETRMCLTCKKVVETKFKSGSDYHDTEDGTRHFVDGEEGHIVKARAAIADAAKVLGVTP